MGEYMAEHGIGYAVLSLFDYDVYEKIELIRKVKGTDPLAFPFLQAS